MFLKSTLHALIELKSMLEKGTLVEELSESGQKKAKKYLPFRKRRPGKRIDEGKICMYGIRWTSPNWSISKEYNVLNLLALPTWLSSCGQVNLLIRLRRLHFLEKFDK